MRRATTLVVLATAVHNAASEVAVCSLPSSALHIADDNMLVACVASKSFSARCRTACSCRRLEIDQGVYGVCLNSSMTFNCDAAENATRCTQGEKSTPSAAIIARKLASNVNSGGGSLKTWQWVLIGLAIALVVGLLIFVLNFFKNRPQRGDNRREVAQTLDLRRPLPKDDVNLLPIVPCKSQARTATSNRESAIRSTTRSHDTNPSQTSDFSGRSYRMHAGTLMSSTLTDTEIMTQHQEPSNSARSSDYSQGMETSTAPNAALLGDSSEFDRRPYPSLSSYSISSDMDSFSSQLTVDDSDIDTGGRAPCPRKKSIEF